jgi:transcription elongation factor GreA
VRASDKTDSVGIGSKVTVKDLEFGTEDTYEIVGSQEADPTLFKVSDAVRKRPDRQEKGRFCRD